MEPKNLQIIEMIGVIGHRDGRISGIGQTLELNLVKTEKGRTMFDLRWWDDTRPRYGLCLSEKSLAELGELISYYFSENYDTSKTLHKKDRR